MGTHQIRIQPGPAGTSKIVIDEEDISGTLSGYTLTDSARRGPELTLNLAIGTRAQVVGIASVEVDPATHNLLCQLGWTPPPSDVDLLDASTHEDLARGTRRYLPGRPA